jgi:4-hydroxybenzoyl-CoA reductase subunit beta
VKLPRFDYAQPRSIDEACALLARRRGAAVALAGGTELLPALRNRHKRARLLVDLARVTGLGAIETAADGGLRLGALVTLRRLADHPLVREGHRALAEAAAAAGSVPLRAMGTLGGNLCQDTCCAYFNRSSLAREMLEPCHKLGGEVCHVVQWTRECWAVYAGDVAPALLALGAAVTVRGPRRQRTVPLARLYSADGKRPLALAPDELVAQVVLPPAPEGSGSAYLKLAQRETIDYPLLGVAARLVVDRGTGLCLEAAVALTAVDVAPVTVAAAERLVGHPPSAGAFVEVARAARKQAHPMKNATGLPPGYRQRMVEVYVGRALRRALERSSS